MYDRNAMPLKSYSRLKAIVAAGILLIMTLLFLLHFSAEVNFFLRMVLSDNKPVKPDRSLKKIGLAPGDIAPKSDEDRMIIVLKGDRKLRYCERGELKKEMPIGLGFAPEGAKVMEGDGRTPEGEYRICVKNPRSRFHLSLGLNYPNVKDGRFGLDNGLISKSEYESIIDADKKGVCPPWNTEMGGTIYIHGHGAFADWTLGCVALGNNDIEYLFDRMKVGDPVYILK